MLINKTPTAPYSKTDSKDAPEFDKLKGPSLGTDPHVKNESAKNLLEDIRDGIRERLPAQGKGEQMRYMVSRAREALVEGSGVINGGINSAMGDNRNANVENMRQSVQAALNDKGIQNFTRAELNTIAANFNRQCSNIYVPPQVSALGVAQFPGGYPKAVVLRENEQNYIKVVFTTQPNGNEVVRWQRARQD